MECTILHKKTISSLIVVFFLSLSLSSAFELQSARLLFDGEDIVYVSPGDPRMGDLHFRITDFNDIDDIFVDYTSLNPGADVSELDIFNDCIASPQEVICAIKGIVIDTDLTEAPVKFFAESDGDEYNATHTFSFIIDTTSPVLVSITPKTCTLGVCTDNCFEDTCYITDDYTRIFLEFEDSQASFTRKRVAFHYGSAMPPPKVHTCNGLVCEGLAKTYCTDGDSVKASIAVGYWGPSSDDAGNPIEGDLHRVFTCDTNPPVIDPAITLTTSSGKDTTHPEVDGEFVSIGETATLEFNVTEATSPALDVSLVSPELNIDEPVTGTCEREDDRDLWKCTISFSPTPQEAVDKATITISVSDIAGHESSTQYKLSVFGVVEGDVDLWSIGTVPTQQANMHYLEYAPKQVFIPLVLNRKTGDARLLEVTPGACTATVKSERQGTTRGTDADLRFDVVSFQGNTVLLRGDLNMGAHYTEHSFVEYECSLEILSLRGNSFVANPETDTFTTKFTLYKSNTIGEQVREEVIDLQNNSLGRLKGLSYAQQTLDGLQMLCTVGNTFKGIGGAFGDIAAALHINPQTRAASEAASKGSAGIQATAEKGQTIINQACNALKCETNYLNDAFGGVGDFVEDAGFSMNQVLNPYDSWLSSLLTLCLPAMSQHMNNYIAIECDYAACLSKDIPTGTATIDMCEQRKSYATCDMVAGGLYNAVPFYSLAKDIVGETINVFRDPVSTFSAAGVIAPCVAASALTGGVVDSLATKVCYAIKGFTGLAEGVQSLVQIHNQLRTMFSFGNFGETSCSNVFDRIDRETSYWDYGFDANAEDVDKNALYRVRGPSMNGQPGKELGPNDEAFQAFASGDENEYRTYLEQGYTYSSPLTGHTALVGGRIITTYGDDKVFVDGIAVDEFRKLTLDDINQMSSELGEEASKSQENMIDSLDVYSNNLFNYYQLKGDEAGSSTRSAYNYLYGDVEQAYNEYMATTDDPTTFEISITFAYDPEIGIDPGLNIPAPTFSHKGTGHYENDPEFPKSFADLNPAHREAIMDGYLRTRYTDAGSETGLDENFFNGIRTTINEFDQETGILEQDLFVGSSASSFIGSYEKRDKITKFRDDIESGESDLKPGTYIIADDLDTNKIEGMFSVDDEGNVKILDENLFTEEEIAGALATAEAYVKEVLEPQLKGGGSRSEFATLLAEFQEIQRKNEEAIRVIEGQLKEIEGIITDFDNYDSAKGYVDSGYKKDAENIAEDIQTLITNERASGYVAKLCPACDDLNKNRASYSDAEFKKKFDEAAIAAAENIITTGGSFTYSGSDNVPNSVKKLAASVNRASSTYASNKNTKDAVEGMFTEQKVPLPGSDVVAQKLMNDLNLNGKKAHYDDCLAAGDTAECAGAKESYESAQEEYDRKMSSMTQTVTVINPKLQQQLDTLRKKGYITEDDYEAIIQLKGTAEGREKILDALEDANDDLSKNAKDLKKEIAKSEDRLIMQKYIDDAWKGSAVIGSVYASFNSVNAVTNSLANQDLLKIGWGSDSSGAFNEGMETLYNAVDSGLETATCRSIGAYGRGSGQLKLNTGGSDSLYSTAAFVAGLKVVEQKVGEWNYSYLLNVYASNQRDVEENLTFEVYLDDKRMPLTEDEEGNLQYTHSLAYKEDTDQWTGASYLRYPFEDGETVPEEYETICIKFTNNNWHLWFDVDRNRQPEFCRELEEG